MPVARGGMASVWAARLKGTRGFQKLVAIKTMLPGLVDDPSFERMFLDEASLASQVRHPHVIEIMDLGEQDRILYLVMEWVSGEALSIIMKYAATRGGIPLPIAVHIATQTCRGLHAAHELRERGRRARRPGAPRRVAAERARHVRRRGQGGGLRRRQGHRAPRHADRGRPAQGQDRLHVAGAAARRKDRSAHRRVRDGHLAVHDDHREAPLPR